MTSPKFSSFEINDLVDSYGVGDTVRISVKYDGKAFDCKFPKILVTNATNSSQIMVDTGGEQNNIECPDYYFVEFFAGIEGFEPITHAQSYLATVSLGGNTLQKKFNVHPDPSRRFYTDIQINDLKNTYTAGIPIDFTVTVKGFGVFDAGPMPEVFVEDSKRNLIWSYQNHIVLCCPVELEELNKELQISRFGGPLIIEKPDTYTVRVTYDHKIIEKRFTVIDPNSKNNDDSQYLLDILDLKENYNVGEEIWFTIHEKGFDVRCFAFFVEIHNSTSNKIWEDATISECPPGLGKSNFENKILFSGIKIDKSGKYLLTVESREKKITRTFSVLDGNLIR